MRRAPCYLAGASGRGTPSHRVAHARQKMRPGGQDFVRIRQFVLLGHLRCLRAMQCRHCSRDKPNPVRVMRLRSPRRRCHGTDSAARTTAGAMSNTRPTAKPFEDRGRTGAKEAAMSSTMAPNVRGVGRPGPAHGLQHVRHVRGALPDGSDRRGRSGRLDAGQSARRGHRRQPVREGLGRAGLRVRRPAAADAARSARARAAAASGGGRPGTRPSTTSPTSSRRRSRPSARAASCCPIAAAPSPT